VFDPRNVRDGNILLDALSSGDRQVLARRWGKVAIDRGEILSRPDRPIEHVYFPTGGIASVVSISADGARTEVGIFGREGMSGSALLLGADRSPHETLIQVVQDEGAEALRIDADAFRDALRASPTLWAALLRYVQVMLVQVSQTAVANARHQIEARLARWLLMCHDRVGSDEILLTHELMAVMIGAQRSGVTVALHVLEGTGTIRSKRGRVIVLDRERLEELAGDGYGIAEAEYRRLIAPFGGQGGGTGPRADD